MVGRKLFLIFAPILFLAAVFCTFHYLITSPFEILSIIGIWLWMAFTLIVLLRAFAKGTFKSSRGAKLSLVGVSILFIGALFKIQHWPYGNELLVFGMLFILAIYIIHFIKKSRKRALDWAKMFYILWLVLSSAASLLHFGNELAIKSQRDSLLVVLAVLIYLQDLKRDSVTDEQAPIANEGDQVFKYED